MDDQLQELQNLSAASREKKWRMDAHSRLRAEDLVADIWSNRPDFDNDILALLGDLSSEAVAGAVSKMWPKLPENRRQELKKWVQGPATERATRRLALLVAAVIETDGVTAVEWLKMLFLSEKHHITKEARQSIATALFSGTAVRFEMLAAAGAPNSELLRIYSALWDIAKSCEFAGNMMSRANLALAFCRLLSSRPANNALEGALLAEIEAEISRWPEVLKDQFRKQMAGVSRDPFPVTTIAPIDAIDYQTPTTANAPPEEVIAPSRSLQLATPPNDPEIAAVRQNSSIDTRQVQSGAILQQAQSRRSSTSECMQFLRERIDGARKDLSMLASMEHVIETLTIEKESALRERDIFEKKMLEGEGSLRSALELSENQRVALKEQLDLLQSEMAKIAAENKFALCECGVLEKKVSDGEHRHHLALEESEVRRKETQEQLDLLRWEMKKMRSTFEEENQRLTEQISANAVGRVDEFRKRVGGSLSRLLIDLPGKDTLMTLDLGLAILLQFHQLVDSLREQGIPVNYGARTQ